ncbi:MAG TPA: aquaporin [Candidatus Angelobacter sp.]|nr:aquaporin [Candidatus Angelobacter sp.]
MATKTAISSTKKSAVAGSQTKKSTIKEFIVCSCKPSKRLPIASALIAEFIGTFILVTAFFQMQGNPLFVGFTLIGIFLIIGGISGAHINPALTIGAWVTRRITWSRAIGYIIAQAAGATIAWLVLKTFLEGAKTATSELYSASSLFHIANLTSDKEWYIFFAELLGVTILAFGFATALRVKREKVAAALSVGLAIVIALYIAISLSSVLLTEANTSLTFLNPAVAFAAALATKEISWSLWLTAIFILAPIIGSIAGFVLHDLLQAKNGEVCECNIFNSKK